MTAQYPAPPVNQTATPTFSVDPVTGAPLSPTDGQATNVSQINGQTVNSSDGNMPVEQADLTTSGTLSAAQSTEGTPVANATLVLSVGLGQSAWRASLVAGAGFTSATTIVADRTVDGTNWITMGFKVGGALANTTVQSVVGPGPLEITGNAAGANKIRIRCSVLNGGESVVVTLRSSAGVADVGLLSSIPAGSNNIGSVTANAGTNLNTSLLALEAGGNLATIATNTTGVATAANQTTGNASLSTLAGAVSGGKEQVNVTQIGGVSTQMSTADGVSSANVQEVSSTQYNSGGPPLSTGVPNGLSLDRKLNTQGKGSTLNSAITTTTAGDTNVTFSVAPKTITQGQGILLSGSGTVEKVYVTTNATITSTTTVFPLQSPIVNSGQTSASWDIFAADGAATSAMTANGLDIAIVAMNDPSATNPKQYRSMVSAAQDAISGKSVLANNAVLYNGTNMDRKRGNLDNITILTVAAQTTSQNGADQTNYNARGAKVYLNMTNVGTGSVTLTIQGKDPVSGSYYTLLTGAAVVTNSFNVYEVYPGVAVTTNVSASTTLPRTWRVITTANNANATTYTCSVSYVL